MSEKSKEIIRKDRERLGLSEFQIQLLEAIEAASENMVVSLKRVERELEMFKRVYWRK